MRLTTVSMSINLLVVSLIFTACTPVNSVNLLGPASALFPRPTLQTKQTGLKSAQSILAGRQLENSTEFVTVSLKAVGMSSIAVQPSKNLNQRRLMAIRAAKMDAYRVLAEQIHGVQLDGQTTVAEAILTSDVLSSAVRGTIMGAETVTIEPTGSDTYKVELSISQVHVDRLISLYKKSLL